MVSAADLGVEAVLFDTFGTVVDWRTGVAHAVRSFAATHGWSSAERDFDPDQFARDWRALYQPAMQAVRSGARDYVPLDQIHLENLHTVIEQHQLPTDNVGDAALDWLNRAWERLDGWPDSVLGLTRLKQGLIVGALSNGTVSLLVRMAKHAGLPWDVVVGSDLSRAYKPDQRAYTFAAELLALQPAQVMLCAAHNSDLAAARAAGLRTAFVPRPTEYGPDQDKDVAPDQDWDLVVTDLVDLADQLVT